MQCILSYFSMCVPVYVYFFFLLLDFCSSSYKKALFLCKGRKFLGIVIMNALEYKTET